MKTIEGYEVVSFKPYDVYTSIYTKTDFDNKIIEKGFSGVVKDPDMDDRFVCNEFCIWNSKGELVYNGKWGQFKGYKLQFD